MNLIPYREFHLFNLLNEYSQQNFPLDFYISTYFRKHKSLGPKDRGFIAETTYALIRWQRLIDSLSLSCTWEERYKTFLSMDLEKAQKDETLPLDVRVSSPSSLFKLLIKNYGLELSCQLSIINNSPAPTTVRVNTLKITREELLKKWQGIYPVSPTPNSKTGIIFHKKKNFFLLPEFIEGLFEIQDEGSQLLAQLVQPKPTDLVLDYCAGSGGKTLAFAPSMRGKGQIYLHDIRPRALQEARKRLRRAGIQNSQVLLPDSLQLNRLKKKMNWVLVDAPCSGTGTFRRNPDMKWKFDEESVNRLIGQQRIIFEKALSFLRPDGFIVYATCSMLQEENQKQVEHFEKTYGLKIEGECFQSLPSLGGMDGFFGVVLKRR